MPWGDAHMGRCSDKKLWAQDADGIWRRIESGSRERAYVLTENGSVVRVRNVSEAKQRAGGKDGTLKVLAGYTAPPRSAFDAVQPVPVRDLHGNARIRKEVCARFERGDVAQLQAALQAELRQGCDTDGSAPESDRYGVGLSEWGGRGCARGRLSPLSDLENTVSIPQEAAESTALAASRVALPEEDAMLAAERVDLDTTLALAVLALRRIGMPVQVSDQAMSLLERASKVVAGGASGVLVFDRDLGRTSAGGRTDGDGWMPAAGGGPAAAVDALGSSDPLDSLMIALDMAGSSQGAAVEAAAMWLLGRTENPLLERGRSMLRVADAWHHSTENLLQMAEWLENLGDGPLPDALVKVALTTAVRDPEEARVALATAEQEGRLGPSLPGWVKALQWTVDAQSTDPPCWWSLGLDARSVYLRALAVDHECRLPRIAARPDATSGPFDEVGTREVPVDNMFQGVARNLNQKVGGVDIDGRLKGLFEPNAIAELAVDEPRTAMEVLARESQDFARAALSRVSMTDAIRLTPDSVLSETLDNARDYADRQSDPQHRNTILLHIAAATSGRAMEAGSEPEGPLVESAVRLPPQAVRRLSHAAVDALASLEDESDWLERSSQEPTIRRMVLGSLDEVSSEVLGARGDTKAVKAAKMLLAHQHPSVAIETLAVPSGKKAVDEMDERARDSLYTRIASTAHKFSERKRGLIPSLPDLPTETAVEIGKRVEAHEDINYDFYGIVAATVAAAGLQGPPARMEQGSWGEALADVPGGAAVAEMMESAQGESSPWTLGDIINTVRGIDAL